MKTFRVSDGLYDQLKSFVVDPFDDTPEIVIGRLIEIVNKAKNRWSSFQDREADALPSTERPRMRYPEPQESEEPEPLVVL